MKALLRTVCLVAPLSLACSSPMEPAIIGHWGGGEVSMTLAAGGGTLQYACGAGTIDAGWTLNRGGMFVATGQHYFGGGPAPIGGAPPHPAIYSGTVEDSRLTLIVTLTDLNQTLGPYHLVRGGQIVLDQCL